MVNALPIFVVIIKINRVHVSVCVSQYVCVCAYTYLIERMKIKLANALGRAVLTLNFPFTMPKFVYPTMYTYM